MDEFKIMPNHLHSIVIINKTVANNCPETHGQYIFPKERYGRASLLGDHDNHGNQQENTKTIQNNIPSKLYRKPRSLSSFIAGYKTGVIQQIDDFIDLNNLPIKKFNHENKLWQSNYHDHIIRNDKEYWRIKNYIKNNPKNWQDDELMGND